MRVATKSRIAVAAMVDLAMRCHAEPVALSGISRRQQISVSYLEQLFSVLVKHKLVKSTRGPGGGYALARPAEAITVADIVDAVDGTVDESKRPAADSGSGLTQSLWNSLHARLLDCLQSITLDTLVLEQQAYADDGDDTPQVRRGISTRPVLMPIKVTMPNSVFALGAALANRR